MTTTTTNLSEALKLAAYGLPVFPVHSIRSGKCTCENTDCGSPGKHPRSRNGFKDATTDEEKIINWWNAWPDANIGLATGKVSGVVVLDVDAKNGGIENLDLLEDKHGKLPVTLIVQTGGGGLHYYFKYPEGGLKCSAGKLAVGIDIRGDGGYVVVPPSNHQSGNEYVWQDNEPGEKELAECPLWIIDELNHQQNGACEKSQPNGEGAEILLKKCLFVQHCEDNAETLSESLWHALACNLALAPGGDELFHELSRPYPNYTYNEAQKKLDNARKKSLPHTCKTISDLGFSCPNMDDEGCCSMGQVRAPIALCISSKDQIKSLAGKDRATIEQKRRLSTLILADLNGQGAFYRTPVLGELYYFFKNEKELYLIGSLEFRALCNELYEINGKDPKWAYIEEDLIVHCQRRGQVTEIYHFARFQNKKLYIHAGGHSVFRLDGESIKTINNGDDGVLFVKNNKMETIEPVFNYEGSPVRELLVNIININKSPEQKGRLDLYHAYIYSIFFESLLPTKPIVLFMGVKGSGKTSAARALKCALFGKSGQVDTGLTEKEDAFWAAVCNSYILCIDNVDKLIRWLADALAVVATGGTFKRRKLYETNTLVEYTPRCFVILTSRNPEIFLRDDVIDRLVLIEVDRREDFIPESVLLENLSYRHGEIWGELLTNLNKIVKAVNQPEKREPFDFRLADWASFVLTVSPILGIENPEQKLKLLEDSKKNFALEDNPIVMALERVQYLFQDSSAVPSGRIFEAIQERYDGTFPIKDPRVFGAELKNLLPELREIYDITVEKGPNNTKLYSIKSKDEN